jgi:hypothetical protein
VDALELAPWKGPLAAWPRKRALAFAADRSELGKLGWWARLADADAEWWLAELERCLHENVVIDNDYHAVWELGRLAPRIPGPALSCLRLMVESGNYSWVVAGRCRGRGCARP